MYENIVAFLPQMIAWLIGVGLGSTLMWLRMRKLKDWWDDPELLRQLGQLRAFEESEWETRYKELSSRHAPVEDPQGDNPTEYNIQLTSDEPRERLLKIYRG